MVAGHWFEGREKWEKDAGTDVGNRQFLEPVQFPTKRRGWSIARKHWESPLIKSKCTGAERTGYVPYFQVERLRSAFCILDDVYMMSN